MGKTQDVSCWKAPHGSWGNTEDVSCGEMEGVSCGKTQTVGWRDAEGRDDRDANKYPPESHKASNDVIFNQILGHSDCFITFATVIHSIRPLLLCSELFSTLL